MPYWLFDFLFTLNRWVHVVAGMMLVGGVLFFNVVLPLATSDLRDEQQLAVFGRARWIFRRVVWWSIGLLAISGACSTLRVMGIYRQERAGVQSTWLTSIPWAVGHAIAAVLAFVLVLLVTRTTRLVNRPRHWLGVTLITLLVGIFLASAARQIELDMGQWSKDANTAHPLSLR